MFAYTLGEYLFGFIMIRYNT